MAQEKKLYLDEQAGQELANQSVAYTDKKIGEVNKSLEGYQPKGDYATKGELPSVEGLATETYVNNKVSGLVDSAPETLDTLKELAEALGNDANFATTVSTNIGKKLDKETYETDKAGFETTEHASQTYQPKGDYALESALEDYQPKGDYALESALAGYQPKGDYVTEDQLESYATEGEVEEKVDELIGAVPVATVQSWFKS